MKDGLALLAAWLIVVWVAFVVLSGMILLTFGLVMCFVTIAEAVL